jgi:hypothetical protein
MTKTEYRKLLEDPRWNAKRLVILERDGNKCTKCGSDKNLQVHHLRYEKDGSPWDSNNSDLTTLCGDCHKTKHKEVAREIKEEFHLIYSSMFVVLKGCRDSGIQLFASLVERYADGREFGFGGTLKKIIAKETGCSPRTLESAFTSILNQKLILKIGYRLYRINPRFIFKGSTISRKQMLE